MGLQVLNLGRIEAYYASTFFEFVYTYKEHGHRGLRWIFCLLGWFLASAVIVLVISTVARLGALPAEWPIFDIRGVKVDASVGMDVSTSFVAGVDVSTLSWSF